MSRKREQKREARREMERQLVQTAADDQDLDALRAHARVCEPELPAAALTLEHARRPLLRFARPLHVHAAVFVVDSAGAQLGRVVGFHGPATARGAVVLTAVFDSGAAKLRYTRPARFVLVGHVVEGASAADLEALRAQLRMPAVMGGVIDGAVRCATGLWQGAAQATRPAVHRLHEPIALPIATADGRFRATLTLTVRA